MKKTTVEEFEKRANEKHNGKYIYHSDFDTMQEKVLITCPIHGDFKQKAYSHLQGVGCPECAKESVHKPKRSQEQMINDLIKVHGDRYIYDRVKCTKIKDIIEVICREHGPFLIEYQSHRDGHGCKKCAGVYHYNNDEYIEKCNIVHNNKYDYSLINYDNANSILDIICHEKDENGNEHGIFRQKAGTHMHGIGCPKCAVEYKARLLSGSREKFIEKAISVHGDQYLYDEVVFKNNHTNVKIICKKHGVFEQLPINHIHGAGCPKCNMSKLEKELMEFFNKKNVKYEHLKPFPWLRYKNPLFLDFYLPEYNVAIECQGEQHFMPIAFNGDYEAANENFRMCVLRDIVKREKCKNKKIPLLYYGKKKYCNEIITNMEELLISVKDNYTNRSIAELKQDVSDNIDTSLDINELKNS